MPSQFHYSQMQRRLPILLLLLLLAAATEHQLPMMMVAGAEEPQPITLAGCPDKCGDTSIPYPFGMTPGCSRPGFLVVCNDSFTPPRAFLARNEHSFQRNYTEPGTLSPGDSSITMNYSSQTMTVKLIELVDVSVATSGARVRSTVSSSCSVNATDIVEKTESTYFDTRPFLLSATRNILVGVGYWVDVELYVNLNKKDPTMQFSPPPCVSHMHDGDQQHAADGLCQGVGCCVAYVPPRAPPLTSFRLRFKEKPIRYLWQTIPCSYGMLVESSWYNFSTKDLYGYELSSRLQRGVPVQVDFAMWSSGDPNSSCPAEGQQRPSDYACASDKSSCSDAATGGGYVCKCLEGYRGNPYIANGCQDIDECEMRKQSKELSDKYPCFGKCNNTVGGYDCRCKQGKKGDAKIAECSDIIPLAGNVVLGISASVLFSGFLAMSLLHLQHRNLKRFYEQNGGPVLKGMKNIKIYRKKQLKQIADNYKHIIGEGHFGKVYMGTMEDKQQVAIKISIQIDKDMKQEFTDEIIIQSEMRHKNIVRLLGCCLEVDAPMLVYEYVARGSLYDVLFGLRRIDIISVDMRLKIALGSAEGLAYMHSAVESTIRHGDVKSANILLDQDFTPKVSDFGTTRLLARGKAEKTDHVIGDLGYIDPVYMEEGVVTQKSDVYSFGVVLIELITRKPAVYDKQRRYVANFVQASLDNETRSFVDTAITSEADIKLLDMVSEVAVECLKPNIEDRLDMKQVEQRLNQIIYQSAQYGQKANYQAGLSPTQDDIPMLKNWENGVPKN